LLLFLVALLAAFTQSLTGFGSALVSMAVLPGLIGIRTAAPLVTLITVTIDVVLLARYRQALNLRAIWRLVAALVLGVPLGILVLRRVEERFVLAILGAVIAGYALYALLSPRLPRLEHPAWAYGFGFIAGVLGGAYNTSGPPVVIFGNCRRWPPAEFKGNLQGFFLVNDLLVIAGHALSQNLTPLVLRDYLIVLPALIVGLFVGGRLDRRLDPALFRKIVLVLLVVMGLRLLVLQ
jgi:hypothetical protein